MWYQLVVLIYILHTRKYECSRPPCEMDHKCQMHEIWWILICESEWLLCYDVDDDGDKRVLLLLPDCKAAWNPISGDKCKVEHQCRKRLPWLDTGNTRQGTIPQLLCHWQSLFWCVLSILKLKLGKTCLIETETVCACVYMLDSQSRCRRAWWQGRCWHAQVGLKDSMLLLELRQHMDLVHAFVCLCARPSVSPCLLHALRYALAMKMT